MTKKVGGPPTSNPSPPPAGEQPAAPAAPGGVSLASLGVGDGLGPTELPRLEPRPPALLMVHPERWMVSEGAVVPLCGRFTIAGGIAGVRIADKRRGTLSITHAVAEKARKGWTVIPIDVDGPGTSYLHQPAPGVYLTRWDKAHAGSSIVTHDNKGYVAWLRGLIARGEIDPPKPYVLERMAGRLRQEILGLQDKVRTVPSAQVDLDRKMADLAVVEAALDTQSLIPAPSQPADLGALVE